MRHHELKGSRIGRMTVIASDAHGPMLRKGLVITTLGGLLFTLDLPLLRLAGADKWTLIGMRGLFLFVSISAVWYVLRQRATNIGYIAGAAGAAVAATNTLANITYIGAIVETSAANVVFITALIPVITAFLSRIFIGERSHPVTWIATVISFVGVGVIVWDGLGHGKILGDILAIISAVCTASAFTIIRGSGRNVATSLAVGSLASALIAIIFFGVNPQSLFASYTYGLPGIAWIALNGLVAIPLASTLIANGPRFLPSADVSMFFLLETVLTPVWVWLLFGEVPTGPVLLGGLIVVATLVAHSLWRIRATLDRGRAGADGGLLP
jgi:drug/metabolite transporter (DMT)-like permease